MKKLFGILFVAIALFVSRAAVFSGSLFADPQSDEQAGEQRATPSAEKESNPPGPSLEEQHRDRDALSSEEEELIRQIDEIEERLAVEKDPEQAERLRGDVANIEQRIVEIWRQIEQINLAIGNNEELPEPLRRQLEELHVAAENFRTAGMGREADQLIAEAESLISEHTHATSMEAVPLRADRQIDELAEEVVYLRQEIQELRAEMDEMYEILENALGLDDSFDPEDQRAEESSETPSGS